MNRSELSLACVAALLIGCASAVQSEKVVLAERGKSAE